MGWLCLLPVLVALSVTSSAKRSFILNGPKQYDVGENETLVLHLFDVKESGSVKIRLLNDTGDDVYSEITVPIKDGQSASVQLPVPSTLPRSIYRAKLEVDGSIGDYRINKSLGVGLRNKESLVFVSTDKPLYKAGQTVHIRVLVTDTNLRPVKDGKRAQIFITDPNRVRIAQWLNESLSEGLLHKNLPLLEEPVLGYWSVNVRIGQDTYSRHFQVKEYVLPTFEVKITPPSYFLITAKNATWKICAKYTYGKPVKGQLFTKLTQTAYYWDKERKFIENRTDIDGCTELTLPVEDLLERRGYYSYRSLELYAEVTETGTGRKMNTTSSASPTNFPYTISRLHSQTRYFRPGIPLQIMMAVKTPDSKPLPGESIKVCMDAVRRKWNDIRTVTDSVKVCKNYTSNKDGNIVFTIPAQDPNTISLTVEVEPTEADPNVQKPRDYFMLSPWFSPSGSHIQLEKFTKIDCTAIGPDTKVSLPFHVTHSETGLKKIHYQIMSRGEIAAHGDFEILLEPTTGENTTDDTYLPYYPSSLPTDDDFQYENEAKPAKYLSQSYVFFKFDETMVPRLKVLLYMVTDDGDIVADSVSFDTDPCFANHVELRFGEEKQSPGAKATIHLTAEPQSLCSVGVVDKSVYLLHKGDLLTGSQITNRLVPLDTHSYTYPDQKTADYTYCSTKKPGYESAGYLDVISAFGDNGGIVLSDLTLETRPCQRRAPSNCYGPQPPIAYDVAYYRPPQALSGTTNFNGFAAERGGAAGIPGPSAATEPPPPPAVTVRTDFPDTWLFQLYKVGDEGSLEMKKKMPDSITEWQGEAICIHSDKGLGISKRASIVAFQPFFASLTLPYSVVRNEVVPVIVTVFNYLKDCLPITVSLHQTEYFSLYNGTSTESICVCGDESSTITFHVRPGKLGIMNVTVTAEATDDQNICGNFDAALDVKRSDTLTKPVVVEAEGFLKEETFNSYFCLSEEEDGTFKGEHLLKLPQQGLVPDSARAYTSVTGDLMGPTLEGLDTLLRMPTGCGEQNMIGFVPNIVVLKYLSATNKLTEEVRRKAVHHLEQGYMRQQKYRHFDGSYSAFGPTDPVGSIWLTAFVVRSFASARVYVNIDEESLESSRRWILSKQRENGCFPVVGTVHNKAMKGGVSKENETTSTLTAYILISMLESGEVGGDVVAKALKCIEAKNKPTNYSLSIFAYAAALAKDNSSSEYLEQLISNAEKDGGLLHWEESDRSIAVETASYGILALLESGKKEDFETVASIAKWLAKQRNSYGGFYSTQDTVMALQALGKYGAIITREPPQMGISIKKENIVDEMFQVTPENELLMQRTKLNLEEDAEETKVEIVASGSGCALVQTSLRYNVFAPEPSRDFELSVTVLVPPDGKCTENIPIAICASYNHPDGSNMAIIEVKMVTGYSPVIESVQKLVGSQSLKRYEFKEDINTLYLYVETLTQYKKCYTIFVTQEVEVLDVKPSRVKVYDYYDEEKSLSVPYDIKETCGEL